MITAFNQDRFPWCSDPYYYLVYLIEAPSGVPKDGEFDEQDLNAITTAFPIRVDL